MKLKVNVCYSGLIIHALCIHCTISVLLCHTIQNTLSQINKLNINFAEINDKSLVILIHGKIMKTNVFL